MDESFHGFFQGLSHEFAILQQTCTRKIDKKILFSKYVDTFIADEDHGSNKYCRAPLLCIFPNPI